MNHGQLFLQALQDGVLIGDGAIGTELFARGAATDVGVERLNVLAPEMVAQLHREYVAAGSRVIETNTFNANRTHLLRYGADAQVREIVLAGVALAQQAATPEVFIAGSVGPLAALEGEPVSRIDQTVIFTEQIAALLDGGVDLLIFESFADLDEITAAIRIARSLCDLPVVAQMAFGIDGCAGQGIRGDEVARRCREAGADVVGANCGYGVPSIRAAIKKMASAQLPMSAYINAGFPEQVEGRLLYLATPDYLARCARDLVAMGVRLIGGCCGTGPATIRAMAHALAGEQGITRFVVPPVPSPVVHVREPEAQTALTATPPPILVELDPPTHLDLAATINDARVLKAAGASAITIADNPLASVRVDTLTTAHLIQQQVGLPVIPHLTGRDRNRIALQSTIMGAHVAGIRTLLCVTGDPVRLCQEPNTSGVFDVTSVGLVRMVADFNAGRRGGGEGQTAFAIGVALNPNVRSINGQIEKLRRKIDAGAQFALTQPVFDEERLDMLQEKLAEAGISIPIYLGVMPLLSSRNAEFLHNEVPGMHIPDAIRERLAGYDAVVDQRAAGIAMAVDLVQRFAPRVHGLYLITPRHQTPPIIPLIEAARQITMTRSETA